jgi:hypothetical protein
VKEQIVVRRADAAKKKPAPAPKAQKPKPVVREAAAPDVSRVPPHEVFANALEEIKGVINAEFRALRAELKLWMKDR